MRKGELATGALSGLSFIAALDAYIGTGTSSWLADICFSGGAPAPMLEDMPVMENHNKHAAYFASAGLIFLAAALGWEFTTDQAAKLTANAAPEGTARKRMLASIIYVTTAAKCANKQVVDGAFEKATGHSLGPNEAKDAYDYLMRANAPDLHRILAGATKKEGHALLRAVVMTWSEHGMDSENSTVVTERIAALLGFDQDDICKTLDRLWLKDQANMGAKATYKLTRTGVQKAARATLQGAKATSEVVIPHARRIGSRAYAAIQR